MDHFVDIHCCCCLDLYLGHDFCDDGLALTQIAVQRKQNGHAECHTLYHAGALSSEPLALSRGYLETLSINAPKNSDSDE